MTILGLHASVGSPLIRARTSVRSRQILRSVSALALAGGLTLAVMTGAYALVGVWG